METSVGRVRSTPRAGIIDRLADMKFLKSELTFTLAASAEGTAVNAIMLRSASFEVGLLSEISRRALGQD